MNAQIVHSYATAFYDMANESGKISQFVEEVDALIPVFQDPETLAFFKSPLFSASEKEQVMVQTLGNRVDPVLADFLKLLARNGRIHLFADIIEQFKANCGDGRGQKKGEVVSATELSDSEKADIKNMLERKLGFPVSLEYSTDKNLIGGIEARVGSYVIEDSLQSNLQKLNDSLKRSTH